MVKKIVISRRYMVIHRFAGHVPIDQILPVGSRRTIPSNQ